MLYRPILLLMAFGFGTQFVAAEEQAKVDFRKQIRPLLSDKCFHCHGPDEQTRQADVRLDEKNSVIDHRIGDQRLVAAGDASQSLLWQRIVSNDPDLVMPPPESGKSLTEAQKKLIQDWIDQGATWDEHWSFQPPVRPVVPTPANQSSVSNPIDAFVASKLAQQNFPMNPRESQRKLVRRLSFDLIGLPATSNEIDAFGTVDDDTLLDQYVDRLLASPRFGEKWGRHWLDAARYADSDGFEKDKPRSVWGYRDWVVAAINEDKPFDDFVVEQIAGDLLPDATQSQLVATGFLRNSMINEEGGVDPEQFRMEAMFDRMDAIGKAILGLSISCSQCHDHKYDPLTQREYYEMFAMINNSNEANVTCYTAEEQIVRARTVEEINNLEMHLKELNTNWQSDMDAWTKEVQASTTKPATLALHWNFDSLGGQKMLPQDDGSFLAQSYAPTKSEPWGETTLEVDRIAAIQLDLLTDPNLPRGGPGRSIFGTGALSEIRVSISTKEDPNARVPVKIVSAVADWNPPETDLPAVYSDRSDKRRKTGPIAFAFDNDPLTAWTTDAGPVRSNRARRAVFVFEKPLTDAKGLTLRIQLAQNHGGWNSDDNQTYNLGRFRVGSISDMPQSVKAISQDLESILSKAPDARTEADEQLLFEAWRSQVAQWSDVNQAIDALWAKHPWGFTQIVLNERQPPRMTSLLDRGDFLKPKQLVSTGTPKFLHRLESNKPAPDRLDFARWLADRQSPTTARAFVNRVWQSLFGIGLSATSEDIGSQGEVPVHPELLDWLACEFMDNDWSVKHLVQTIVASQTYRQSSTVRPDHLAIDPNNRLLARGPRVRLDGELVRDAAMSISGLMDDRIGGPSAYPPAPEFLFQPPVSYGPKTWNEATGGDRYRRSLYTFRFRSVPYPPLQAFDTPNGDAACVRRSMSNTPLQALTALNETVFVECAQSMARRTMQFASTSDTERIAWLFAQVVGRSPSMDEREVATKTLDKIENELGDDAQCRAVAGWDSAALSTIPKFTESPRELAKWTILARVILNLDETITKE